MSNIIIVDDQFTSRRIMEELVSTLEQDITVKTFSDPREALGWARDNHVDLVLTDFRMPAMDGAEFTRRLRQLDYCKDVPVIVVTVIEDREIRYNALAAGATDFLTKPIDHTECRARCRNLLTLRNQQQIIKNRAKWLEQQVAKATGEIHQRERETLLRLGKAGEFRDQNTSNHVIRMASYCRLIAEQLGRSENECDLIELAAPMHDIGKIGIPDRILLKPGKHTHEERDIMQTHATIGHEILKNSPSRYLQMGALVALTHHEKFDGSGYPRGLFGEEIPIAARIAAVSDVFDALTASRPYKPAWSVPDAADYLEREAGKHFDPACIDAFMTRMDDVLHINSEYRDVITSKTG